MAEKFTAFVLQHQGVESLEKYGEPDRLFVLFKHTAIDSGMIDVRSDYVTQSVDLYFELDDWTCERRSRIYLASLLFGRPGRLTSMVAVNQIDDHADLAQELAELELEIAADERYNQLRVDAVMRPLPPRSCG